MTVKRGINNKSTHNTLAVEIISCSLQKNKNVLNTSSKVNHVKEM